MRDKALEIFESRNHIGLRKNTARKLNERSVKRRKLFEPRHSRGEFFLRSAANEISDIFSAALIFSFVLSFVSRQKKEQLIFSDQRIFLSCPDQIQAADESQ